MVAKAKAKAKAGWQPGHKHTPETRAKISESMKGKSLSAETRRRIGASRRLYNESKREAANA